MALGNLDALITAASSSYPLERRSSRRFALALPVQLAVRGTPLQGVTVNISSGGLLVRCERPIVAGTRVMAAVELLQCRGTQTTLVIRGIVMRCEPGVVAIRRTGYVFTRSGEGNKAGGRGRAKRRPKTPTRSWNRCGHNEGYWLFGDLR